MGLLKDRIVVVTGASRGAGKGIALALGATGATIYVTGRTHNEGDAPLPGTVQATADAVTAAGGKGIPVYCDHADDAQVQQPCFITEIHIDETKFFRSLRIG